MRSMLLAALLCGAAPAVAQTTPAPASAQVDPARLALARTTVNSIWPLGTYQRMMSTSMDQMMNGMMGSMFDMKLGDMVPADGKELSEEEKKVAQTTMREAIMKGDPHFEERMRITNRVIMTDMGVIFSKLEPSIREGLAVAYAKKFDAGQLADLNAFFATPTGKVYASESVMLFTDPELMKAMMAGMPEMMKAMPAMMEKVKKATAHLPEPPKPKKSEDSDEEGEHGEQPVA
jgi:uncharacterized protein (DUF2342 family)